MKKHLLNILLTLYLFTSTVSAIGISPNGIETGTLNTSYLNTYPFEIKNLNTYPYSINLTFELTESSKYLSQYVLFSPRNIVITPADKIVPFTVTVGGDIPQGNHLLIFKTNIDILTELPMNNTVDINTAGVLISTSSSYISFNISAKSSPPAPQSTSSSSGAVPSGYIRSKSPYPNETKVNVIEYIGLTIELPLVVRAVKPSVTTTIKLKNIGNKDMSNLFLEIFSTPPLNITYDRELGTLNAGQDKSIDIKLSNYTASQHIITAVIYSHERANNWSASFILTETGEPRGIILDNCLEYGPQNFTVNSKRKSHIQMYVRNKCNTTLQNLNVIINSLNYQVIIQSLNINETIPLKIYPVLPTGLRDHRIIFVYDNGHTIGEITINSKPFYFDRILYAIISISILMLMLFPLDLFRRQRNTKKN